MNFGLMAAAIALTIVAFIVAVSSEEIRATTPPHLGTAVTFQGHQKHRVKMANHRHGAGHSTVAALESGSHPSLP